MVDHPLRAGQADRAAAAGSDPVHARLTPRNLKPNPTASGRAALWLHLHGADADDRRLGPDGHLLSRRQFRPPRGGRDQAACQVASHFVKLVYFGSIIDQAATLDPVLAIIAVAASMTGTTLARRFLEAMTDLQFRTWAGRLITTVACYYIIYGSWLLLARSNAFAF
jgi:hypothetical protein